MTPTSWPLYSVLTFEAKGRSTSSVTGRASMSARRATTGPGQPSPQKPHHPGVSHFRLDLHPQGPEVLRDQASRPELPIPQLGVLVKIPAPGHDLVGDGLHSGIDLGPEGVQVGLLRRSERRSEERREEKWYRGAQSGAWPYGQLRTGCGS